MMGPQDFNFFRCDLGNFLLPVLSTPSLLSRLCFNFRPLLLRRFIVCRHHHRRRRSIELQRNRCHKKRLLERKNIFSIAVTWLTGCLEFSSDFLGNAHFEGYHVNSSKVKSSSVCSSTVSSSTVNSSTVNSSTANYMVKSSTELNRLLN